MADDLVITVGADLGPLNADLKDAEKSVAQTVQKLKESQIGLAQETKALSAEYNKNAKALRELYDIQKNGLGFTAQTTTKIKALTKVQQELSASIVDSKGVYKDADNAIKAYDKSLLATEETHSKVGAAIHHLTNFQDIAAHSIKGFGRDLLHMIPALAFEGVAVAAGIAIGFLADNFFKTSEATQLAAININNVNEVMKEANKDAGKQTADLKILYEAATNVNLSMKDRLTAVKGLQNEFPEFFKNLSKEAILNGSAQTAYEGATKSIIANARATAALSKIRELSGKQLDSEQEKQEILNKMRANDLEDTKANLNDKRDAESRGLDQFTAIAKKGALQQSLDQNKANAKALQDQIEFLEKFATLPELVKAVDVPVPKIKKEKVEKAIKEAKLLFSKGAKVDKIEIPLDLLPPKASQLNSTIKYSFDTISKKLRAKMDEMRAIVAEGLTTIQTDTLAGLGEALGSAIGGGKDTFKGLFDGIFNSVGDQLQNLGKFLIKSAIEIKLAKDAFKKLLANPIASIAVGIGLIALGALIKQQLKKDAPGFAGGGFINGPGSKTSDSINARLSRGEYVIKADSVSKYGKSFFDMINGGNFSRNNNYANGGMVNGSIGGGQLITVEVVGNIRGNDIFIANKRAGLKIGRNG